MITLSILARDFVEEVLGIAKKNLEIDGRLFPVLFVQPENGLTNLVPLQQPGTPEEKQAYFRALGSWLRHSGRVVQEALMLSEGWFVEAKKSPDVWNIRPSRHPDRREAITAVGRNANRTRYTSVVQPFARNGQDKFSWKAPAMTFYNQPFGNGSFPVGLLDLLFAST